MSSLNPVFTIGDQIGEPIRIHRGADRKAAMNAAVALLESVGIPDARRRAGQYPHELSGGMMMVRIYQTSQGDESSGSHR